MRDVKRFLDLLAAVVSADLAKQAWTLATHERYSCRDPARVDVDASGEGAARTVPDNCRFGIGEAFLGGLAGVQTTP